MSMQNRIAGRTPAVVLIIGLSFAALAAPAGAAKPRDMVPDAAPARGLPDSQIAPLSLQMLKAGESALALGKTQAAADSFEAALAADPRNRRAYIGLARAAEAEGLPGKAVRFYREALEIEPNDVAAIEAQGVALVERGATARAEMNLERLKKLCTGPCPQADRLAAAIAKGPTRPAGQTAALDNRED
jgi:Tfp pilus assembly protein PilF